MDMTVFAALHMKASDLEKAARVDTFKNVEAPSCQDKGKKKASLAAVQEQPKVATMNCFNYKKPGHIARMCKTLKCFKCGKLGHVSSRCRVQGQILHPEPLAALSPPVAAGQPKELLMYQGKVFALIEPEAPANDVISVNALPSKSPSQNQQFH